MTAVLTPAATSTSPAVGTQVGVEFVGRHVDDGLIAHWAPNSTGSYYVYTACGLVLIDQSRPFTPSMAVCLTCFDPSQACPWCGTHCDTRLDHLMLRGWASRIGKPTLLPDGTLRPAPPELRFVKAA